MLFRWVAENKDTHFVDAMVGVSTPFDLIACIDKMNFVYNRYLTFKFKDSIIRPNLRILKELEL
jgi:predicted alpha/beta-fold hydrolase